MAFVLFTFGAAQTVGASGFLAVYLMGSWSATGGTARRS